MTWENIDAFLALWQYLEPELPGLFWRAVAWTMGFFGLLAFLIATGPSWRKG